MAVFGTRNSGFFRVESTLPPFSHGAVRRWGPCPFKRNMVQTKTPERRKVPCEKGGRVLGLLGDMAVGTRILMPKKSSKKTHTHTHKDAGD